MKTATRLAIRQRETRAAARARRNAATGTPQTARTWLVASGLSDADAKRYAGAFSRGVLATATTTTRVKLRGRVTKNVKVKLYSQAAFVARLAMYRPADKAAASRFAAVAA